MSLRWQTPPPAQHDTISPTEADVDTPIAMNSALTDWTEGIPRPPMTGRIPEVPQSPLEVMGRRESALRLGYSDNQNNHLAIYLPDGTVVRWHPEETNNQFHSEVIRNDGKA